MTAELPALWHVRFDDRTVGEIVEPGQWGRIVTMSGAYGTDQPTGSPFHFREHLLELFRVTQTDVAVSRLACAFAFESRDVALETARLRNASGVPHACYAVEPVDATRPMSRHDMLWITWMGEPKADYNRVAEWLGQYWNGAATESVADHARSTWEWLVASGLRIVGRAD